MNKFVLSTLVVSMLSFSAFALSGDVVPASQSPSVGVNYIENDTAQINVDKMKRADKVKDAESKAMKNDKKRVQVNSADLNRQRALDYSTQRTNSMFSVESVNNVNNAINALPNLR